MCVCLCVRVKKYCLGVIIVKVSKGPGQWTLNFVRNFIHLGKDVLSLIQQKLAKIELVRKEASFCLHPFVFSRNDIK